MRHILTLGLALYVILIGTPYDVFAHGYESSTIKIHHPWARATPKGADVAGGFMIIENTGSTDDRLVILKVTGVKKAEIHEMAMANGMMTMRPLADGIVIPACQSLALKPGSFHIMMMGLSAPLLEGDYVKATLQFEKAGTIEIEFAIEAQGANLKPADMNHQH